VDWLYYFIYWLCVIYFVHIILIMVYFMVRYRRQAGVDVEKSPHHSLALEISWSVPPAILVVFMFWWGFTGYVDLKEPPADAYKIQLIAKQWDFRFVYPNGVVHEELHVPPGEPIELVMESEDVLHAAFIPKFRVKQDIIPGRFTELWFTAKRPSVIFPGQDDLPKSKQQVDYWLFCAEFCGTSHSKMWSKVIVHTSRAEYDAWLKGEDKPMPPQKVYKIYCKSCHNTTAERLVGPSFKGLFGSQRKVFDPATGETTTVTADEQYLKESITNPGKYLSRHGDWEFGNLMTPDIANKLRPEELVNVIQFIKELK
jgi:cytochrome c oxidase subunit 2